MIGEDHLTRFDLQGMAAGQKALPFVRRLRGVVHLTMDCGACWSALGRDEITCEPEGFADPLVRAVFRSGRRRLCLAHRGEHLQAARDVRLRDLGFAYLVLQEAITRSYECRSTFLSQVPAKLADELLAARAESSQVRDLQVAILCAVANFHLRVGNAASARKCLESAERYLEEGSGEEAPRLDVLVAKMRLASFEGKTGEAFERQREICRQLSPEEPVRRFEVACDALTRTMPGPRPSQRLAEWALAQLHGASGRRLSEHPDPVYRLSGLFQQAPCVRKTKCSAETSMTLEDLVKLTRLIARHQPDDLPAWLFLVHNSARLRETVFAMMTIPSNDVLHRLLRFSDDTTELVAEFHEMTRAAQQRAGRVSGSRVPRPRVKAWIRKVARVMLSRSDD